MKDIVKLWQQVNRKYFNGALDADVAYFAKRARRPDPEHKRNITLGYCQDVEGEVRIRINPIIGHPIVPVWIAKAILLHEALHIIHREAEINGVFLHHTPAFKRAEARYSILKRYGIWWSYNRKRVRRYLSWAD